MTKKCFAGARVNYKTTKTEICVARQKNPKLFPAPLRRWIEHSGVSRANFTDSPDRDALQDLEDKENESAESQEPKRKKRRVEIPKDSDSDSNWMWQLTYLTMDNKTENSMN